VSDERGIYVHGSFLLYSYRYSPTRVLDDGRLAVRALPVVLEIRRRYDGGIPSTHMLAVWPVTYHSLGAVIHDPTFM
jgi:hypothetical protein